MSGNLNWQEQQVRERVQGALREGLVHRKVRGRRSGGTGSVAVKAALILGAAWFFLAITAAGCTPMESAKAAEPERAPFMTMAERIAFQDRVWEASYSSAEPGDLTELSPGDVSAYRWNAMARFYASHFLGDLTELSPGDVSAYRWIAMARFYARHLPVEYPPQ